MWWYWTDTYSQKYFNRLKIKFIFYSEKGKWKEVYFDCRKIPTFYSLKNVTQK